MNVDLKTSLRPSSCATKTAVCNGGSNDECAAHRRAWFWYGNAAPGERVAENTERGPGRVAVITGADAIQILVQTVGLCGGGNNVGKR